MTTTILYPVADRFESTTERVCAVAHSQNIVIADKPVIDAVVQHPAIAAIADQQALSLHTQ